MEEGSKNTIKLKESCINSKNLKRMARANKSIGLNYSTNLQEYNLSLAHNLKIN